MSSEMIINNLKSQLMIYQQMFEQLTSPPTSTSTSTSTFTPTSTSTPTSTFIPTSSTTEVIIKPKKGYVKVEEILQIFNITKAQYNNILVRINDILNLLF